jgi:hypothetical protein
MNEYDSTFGNFYQKWDAAKKLLQRILGRPSKLSRRHFPAISQELQLCQRQSSHLTASICLYIMKLQVKASKLEFAFKVIFCWRPDFVWLSFNFANLVQNYPLHTLSFTSDTNFQVK